MTKNEKIGAAIVGGVILYLLFKKPKFFVVEKETQPSGGGGGIMPIIMPLSTAPTTTTTTATTPPNTSGTSASKPLTTPTCPSGQRWNLATQKCEVIPTDKEVGSGSGGTSTKPPIDSTPPLEVYDPCKTNNYGGTYAPASNTCVKSPYCGGGTLKLDSQGKAIGCATDVPTGGGVVIGGNVGFSGKLPLTLDNLLM